MDFCEIKLEMGHVMGNYQKKNRNYGNEEGKMRKSR